MRILLSEGSSLTSRLVATRLGELGHEVEVLSSTPLCLARFTRHVARVHRVPRLGKHPLAWLDAAIAIATRRHVDVLFPTQEIAVLSAFAPQVPVPTIVPPFAALVRVQDKLSASRTIAELGPPQPRTIVAAREDELEGFDALPAFVKPPREHRLVRCAVCHGQCGARARGPRAVATARAPPELFEPGPHYDVSDPSHGDRTLPPPPRRPRRRWRRSSWCRDERLFWGLVRKAGARGDAVPVTEPYRTRTSGFVPPTRGLFRLPASVTH